MSNRGSRPAYLAFWNDTGANFPSLKKAASTRYYLECEQLLCEEFFPGLENRLLFKSDLWDEAKNSEILLWAAGKGARPFGIDIAPSTVRQASEVLAAHEPGCVVADVRAIPFRTDAFDLIYSMGTIEHFPDYTAAVQELYRILKPQGVAIVGVPNKLDPFMRPLMVHLLNKWKLYAYGMEKSFTSGELSRLLESAGFTVSARSGILFIPGWLRILDLWCHLHCRPLAAVTGWAILPFAWLYRTFPLVRRHGYLIACVVRKPACERRRTRPA